VYIFIYNECGAKVVSNAESKLSPCENKIRKPKLSPKSVIWVKVSLIL
jgi:hypothetical protein